MKISPLSLAFVSSASAFSPLMVGSQKAASVEAAMVTDIDVQRPIYDPLGLYPKSSPESLAGLIQPFEGSMEQQHKAVVDPLSIYPGTADVANLVEMSASLPFLERPAMLDGSLPGDRGFDPFYFSSNPEALQWYRNSEIKHSRLAMLAAAGWPLAELFHKNIASALDLKPLLAFQDRVPSVLNGGLSHISPTFWVAALAVAALAEAAVASEEKQAPGDLGFDPLGLAGIRPKQKHYMQEAELFNGRLSMLAITGFAIQEWWTQSSVVNDFPIFFKPLNVAFEQLVDAGGNSL
jgi:hypothetical protein